MAMTPIWKPNHLNECFFSRVETEKIKSNLIKWKSASKCFLRIDHFVINFYHLVVSSKRSTINEFCAICVRVQGKPFELWVTTSGFGLRQRSCTCSACPTVFGKTQNRCDETNTFFSEMAPVTSYYFFYNLEGHSKEERNKLRETETILVDLWSDLIYMYIHILKWPPIFIQLILFLFCSNISFVEK